MRKVFSLAMLLNTLWAIIIKAAHEMPTFLLSQPSHKIRQSPFLAEQ